jgi:signal peptidase II
VQSLIVAGIVVLLDQVTKSIIAKNIAICERLDVWGNVLRITHIRNTGAVFGIMKGAGTYFTVFSIVAAGVLIVALFIARRSSRLVRVSLGLVLGGAVGNLIDRLRFGAVVDFMDVGINEGMRWPCFNAADLAITVGVILLVGNSLRSHQQSIEE